MERLLYRLAVGSAVAGLGILLLVMASGRAWPDPIYAIGWALSPCAWSFWPRGGRCA